MNTRSCDECGDWNDRGKSCGAGNNSSNMSKIVGRDHGNAQITLWLETTVVYGIKNVCVLREGAMLKM